MLVAAAAGLWFGSPHTSRSSPPISADAYQELTARQRSLAAAATAARGLRRADTLSKLAEVLSALRRAEEAAAARLEAVTLMEQYGADAASKATAHAAAAQELKALGRYDEAHAHVAQAAQTAQLPLAATAVLAELAASIHDCSGDFVSALQTYEQAMRIRPPSPRAVLTHVDYLRKVLRADPPPPFEVAAAMRKRADGLVEGLVSSGPWETAQQLPGAYVRGLRSWPFPPMQHWDSLQRAAGVLEASASELRQEYFRLSGAGLLKPDAECIGDGVGKWRRFETNAPWHPRDESGCAVDSPTACSVLRRIRDLGVVTVLRAGYSEVAAGTWLRPHHGTTNGQLKLHLGVVVPPGGCATIRVGGQTRAWTEGAALAASAAPPPFAPAAA
eukprot:TRINITY_DN11176_c0_g1_i3.p1 TRINITY_DN11176_c0_g1~~TRINITY_DN11176_c0_g1_i3.p1  ORF type:complete len:424 (+),score=116.65 TRINITY_DN11176_c0_g1_i3:110-1273(+)